MKGQGELHPEDGPNFQVQASKQGVVGLEGKLGDSSGVELQGSGFGISPPSTSPQGARALLHVDIAVWTGAFLFKRYATEGLSSRLMLAL